MLNIFFLFFFQDYVHSQIYSLGDVFKKWNMYNLTMNMFVTGQSWVVNVSEPRTHICEMHMAQYFHTIVSIRKSSCKKKKYVTQTCQDVFLLVLYIYNLFIRKFVQGSVLEKKRSRNEGKTLEKNRKYTVSKII